MKVLAAELGPFAARTLALVSETGGAAAIVDPGLDFEAMVERIRSEAIEPRLILLTHAHLDHAYGLAEARAAFPGAPVLLHAADLPLLRNLEMQAQMFGFPPPRPVHEDGTLEDGQVLAVGDERLIVRHTPGHSPGHVVLVHEHPERPLAVVGDVLFAGSIGRTDLWGGSYDELEASIRDVLYRLPGNTRVIPGHGPETTIAEERASNPFVAG